MRKTSEQTPHSQNFFHNYGRSWLRSGLKPAGLQNQDFTIMSMRPSAVLLLMRYQTRGYNIIPPPVALSRDLVTLYQRFEWTCSGSLPKPPSNQWRSGAESRSGLCCFILKQQFRERSN
ncbi:hypothetical protein AVEN_66843-1 [Araneus ventricosus]|uniref:Uncharacterized protein n=1 Tax=Araneus ventricosus TaxID=182803 RepID=A0A4Y2DSA4_ARAVE|nr:hypothetical protein AVEN_66843-1 [Araneus ventricosus]